MLALSDGSIGYRKWFCALGDLAGVSAADPRPASVIGAPAVHPAGEVRDSDESRTSLAGRVMEDCSSRIPSSAQERSCK